MVILLVGVLMLFIEKLLFFSWLIGVIIVVVLQVNILLIVLEVMLFFYLLMLILCFLIFMLWLWVSCRMFLWVMFLRMLFDSFGVISVLFLQIRNMFMLFSFFRYLFLIGLRNSICEQFCVCVFCCGSSEVVQLLLYLVVLVLFLVVCVYLVDSQIDIGVMFLVKYGLVGLVMMQQLVLCVLCMLRKVLLLIMNGWKYRFDLLVEGIQLLLMVISCFSDLMKIFIGSFGSVRCCVECCR